MAADRGIKEGTVTKTNSLNYLINLDFITYYHYYR